ncbi:hypothetical protein A675_01992 [Salmonella enterica subsp. enterica serovar Enteritidis str. 2009K1726]|nr:hypothetical protein A672_02638 [Salmonella enterica subsp. enterica serovar Enteritidis str. 08-1080]EPI86693.1 hypothetical protein A675_01992 [Salmonella enterica subsp. enterica serovar Enteritidis str. 2009K1726]
MYFLFINTATCKRSGTFYPALTGRRYVSTREYKTVKEYILQAINDR